MSGRGSTVNPILPRTGLLARWVSVQLPVLPFIQTQICAAKEGRESPRVAVSCPLPISTSQRAWGRLLREFRASVLAWSEYRYLQPIAVRLSNVCEAELGSAQRHDVFFVSSDKGKIG